jgi:PEP-CTERM motif
MLSSFITGPDGEGMTDLNSLVELPDGVILEYAKDINDMGQVIVTSFPPAIPEPEIPVLLLAGLTLVGFIAWRKKEGAKLAMEEHDPAFDSGIGTG